MDCGGTEWGEHSAAFQIRHCLFREGFYGGGRHQHRYGQWFEWFYRHICEDSGNHHGEKRWILESVFFRLVTGWVKLFGDPRVVELSTAYSQAPGHSNLASRM